MAPPPITTPLNPTSSKKKKKHPQEGTNSPAKNLHLHNSQSISCTDPHNQFIEEKYEYKKKKKIRNEAYHQTSTEPASENIIKSKIFQKAKGILTVIISGQGAQQI